MCLFLLSSFVSKGQTFTLADTVFKVNDVMRTYRIVPNINNNEYIMLESRPFLDSLAKFLIKNKNLVIEIGNYTDFRGTDKVTLMLSQARSRSVMRYLVDERSIAINRLVSMGYGETNPLISQEKIEKMKDPATIRLAHRINVRTELKILSVDYLQQ